MKRKRPKVPEGYQLSQTFGDKLLAVNMKHGLDTTERGAGIYDKNRWKIVKWGKSKWALVVRKRIRENPPLGKWLKAQAVRIRKKAGKLILDVRQPGKKRNPKRCQRRNFAGYYDSEGRFRPIRSSTLKSGELARVKYSRRKAEKPKRKPKPKARPKPRKSKKLKKSKRTARRR